MPLSAEKRSGFVSPYFIVPKKSGGLQPILDLRVLIRVLHKLDLELSFKILMHKRIFEFVRPLNWFAVIDLKDARFHVSILPSRASLRFAFEGQLCPYKLLAFGHLSQLGFRVNRGKIKLVPMQRISFLGMELNSVSHLHWHTYCLELLAVLLAPSRLRERLRGNARHGCTGTQLAPGPAQKCVPPVSLLAETLCKIREDKEHVLLVAPYWPSRIWFPQPLSGRFL